MGQGRRQELERAAKALELEERRTSEEPHGRIRRCQEPPENPSLDRGAVPGSPLHVAMFIVRARSPIVDKEFR